MDLRILRNRGAISVCVIWIAVASALAAETTTPPPPTTTSSQSSPQEVGQEKSTGQAADQTKASRQEPSLQPSPLPASSFPSDLLFQSIQKELTVERPIQLEPIAEKPTNKPNRDSKRKPSEKDTYREMSDRPWDAVESLMRGARQLEKRAKKAASSDPELAESLNRKSAAIRELVIELLSFPVSEPSNP